MNKQRVLWTQSRDVHRVTAHQSNVMRKECLSSQHMTVVFYHDSSHKVSHEVRKESCDEARVMALKKVT